MEGHKQSNAQTPTGFSHPDGHANDPLSEESTKGEAVEQKGQTGSHKTPHSTAAVSNESFLLLVLYLRLYDVFLQLEETGLTFNSQPRARPHSV